MTTRHLTLADISDLRAYERQRAELRRRIIALKRLRRVAVGPIVSLVFESAETIRFQVNEMARAERMISDEQIQAELDAYNPLIPQPAELSATLFLELTDQPSLRHWLPRLVGIERSVVIDLPDSTVVAATPEPTHEERLTRHDVTSAVHYIRFAFTSDQVDAFARGPVILAVRHPEYDEEAAVSPGTRDELLGDLRG